MKRVYNNYFLVGLFTLLVGGTSIFLLLSMSGKNENSENYYSYFANVTNLGYGNPVYFEGYRVGQVEIITPETINGRLFFKIEYSVIKDWKIPTDSLVKIESSGLLSDMSLGIHSGKATSFILPKHEIKSKKSEDIMATITQLANDLSSLNEDGITPLIELIHQRIDSITAPIEEQVPLMLTSLSGTLKNIDKLVNSANEILNKDNTDNIDKIILNFTNLSSELSTLGLTIETTFQKLDNLIISGQTLIDENNTNIADLLNSTNQIVKNFSSKAETIANELESASMNINEATDIIRRNPSTLVFDKKSKIADEDL